MSRGYHAIEAASRDEITALQTERMQWSLRHAYENVPYFKAKCEAHGAHPDDFRALGDLARFPFTTKEDLRQLYLFLPKSFQVLPSIYTVLDCHSGVPESP